MSSILILRVDPGAMTVVPLRLKFGKNAVPEARRIIRAKHIGQRELMQMDSGPLVVAGGLDVNESMAGWRIRGCEDHAGIGILFGRQGSIMRDCPVSARWVHERVTWLEGEDVAGREERARQIIDMIEPDLRDAVRNALVLPDGMWLPSHVHAAVGAAMLRLDLGTERTDGQKLSPLGESLRDILNETEA